MTRNDAKKSLLENGDLPKEIRTNDGMRFLTRGVESWAMNGDQLLIIPGGPKDWQYVSIRNIASIGPVRHRRRA